MLMKCLVIAMKPISYFSINLVMNLVIFTDFIFSTKLNYSSLDIAGHKALILSKIITLGFNKITSLYLFYKYSIAKSIDSTEVIETDT